jgi:hypothetical protein
LGVVVDTSYSCPVLVLSSDDVGIALSFADLVVIKGEV